MATVPAALIHNEGAPLLEHKSSAYAPTVPTRLQNRADYLTVGEFCREWGTSEQHTYRMCREGHLPHVRFSNRIYIHRDTLEAWLMSQEIASTEGSKKHA